MIAAASNYELPRWLTSLFSKPEPPPRRPTRSDTLQTSFPCWDTSTLEYFAPDKHPGSGLFIPKRPKSSPRRLSKPEVLSDLMLRAATNRSFRSQDDAARHYGVSPSRFSEWSKVWETEGSIRGRRMVGRCKILMA